MVCEIWETDDSTNGAQLPGAAMRRVAIASCVGTTIEFYDFLTYGTAAALVFPKVFSQRWVRPPARWPRLPPSQWRSSPDRSGRWLFGHYGDRIGRKQTLITTLLLMGVSTVLIGLLPVAATIGVAAPVLLVVLRFAQGLAVGGEWASATLLPAEYAPPGQRGRYAMFPQLGPADRYCAVQRNVPGYQSHLG
ncbi:MAG TPA: MFS transporter [Pseudonocardiaceae bacterium]|nr:MFS transporter [Pseudonocardiaceae bacterium]